MARKSGELPGKAGVKSLAKKLGSSRHAFEPHPGAGKTAGAFGKEEEEVRAHESASGSTRESKVKALEKMRRR
jgi:hypothetical protein